MGLSPLVSVQLRSLGNGSTSLPMHLSNISLIGGVSDQHSQGLGFKSNLVSVAMTVEQLNGMITFYASAINVCVTV